MIGYLRRVPGRLARQALRDYDDYLRRAVTKRYVEKRAIELNCPPEEVIL